MKLNGKQKDDLWAMVITFAMIGFFVFMAIVSYLSK
jgi:hypothetical protein